MKSQKLSRKVFNTQEKYLNVKYLNVNDSLISMVRSHWEFSLAILSLPVPFRKSYAGFKGGFVSVGNGNDRLSRTAIS